MSSHSHWLSQLQLILIKQLLLLLNQLLKIQSDNLLFNILRRLEKVRHILKHYVSISFDLIIKKSFNCLKFLTYRISLNLIFKIKEN